MTQEEIDFTRIKKAILYVTKNYTDQPRLEEVAEHCALSPYHFQRLFTRWAGISPKKYLQYITLKASRERLEQCPNLAEVADEVGLSGTSRLHDLYVTIEGMTPQQYKRRGEGVTISYGAFPTRFGKCLIAVTGSDKVCFLAFLDEKDDALSELSRAWSRSEIIHDPKRTSPFAGRIFGKGDGITAGESLYREGEALLSAEDSRPGPLDVLLKGTEFQLKVWEALLKIPFGSIASYQSVADSVGRPEAVRAAAGAIARNPVAYLIPCHRVIRKEGRISEYRWGAVRKAALIGWEAARIEAGAAEAAT